MQGSAPGPPRRRGGCDALRWPRKVLRGGLGRQGAAGTRRHPAPLAHPAGQSPTPPPGEGRRGVWGHPGVSRWAAGARAPGRGPPTPQTRRRFRGGRAAAAAYTPGHGLTLNCIVSPAPTTRRGFMERGFPATRPSSREPHHHPLAPSPSPTPDLAPTRKSFLVSDHHFSCCSCRCS